MSHSDVESLWVRAEDYLRKEREAISRFEENALEEEKVYLRKVRRGRGREGEERGERERVLIEVKVQYTNRV